ncbi:hypothetical protein SAMD00019534_077630 [Acytostelium subglobosum LB1]|uniref:hypothetical protein n=1 Tax=Acytostelium subglobosum LB1 TaxID=1410327 RepID=UPI0006450812|nr:hypothetical protein SAMD00019534_077630 [Acytostelium subglobosum LB1]GAM24588.1 hypothetical protein SAMD00019534_077630 [Acytostelium subglobosum LB1]|eukprot:XP_012752257.1 hypothetical protein SAMD00019534_077630 [Acytostelium subglobosum LB1]
MKRKPKYVLNTTLMCELMKNVGLPDSKVTEDVFNEFANIMDDAPNLSYRCLGSMLMQAASIGSLKIIKFLVEKMSTFERGDSNSAVHMINPPVMGEIIDTCIKQDDIESMEYLIQVAIKVTATGGFKYNTGRLFNLHLCSTKILTHLFDKGYITVDDPKDNIVSFLVDGACQYGKLDIIRLVHQRCTTPAQLRRHLPSLYYINLATGDNFHEVLTYLFEGDGNGGEPSPFKRAEVKFDLDRMLRSIYLFIVSLIDWVDDWSILSRDRICVPTG